MQEGENKDQTDNVEDTSRFEEIGHMQFANLTPKNGWEGISCNNFTVGATAEAFVKKL